MAKTRLISSIFVAFCLGIGTASAQDRNLFYLEKLNDGPSELGILAHLVVMGGSVPYATGYAKGRLSFFPKITSNWRLVMRGYPAWFHILDVAGAPCTPSLIWDDGHHTTSSGWLAVAFSGCNLTDGNSTFLVSNPVAGADNGVWIDAR